MTDPLTASVMIILGKYALDKGTILAKEVGPQAVVKAGELFKTVLDHLRGNPNSEVIADEYEADPGTYAKPMEKKLDEAIQADAGLKAQLEKLLTEYETEAKVYAPSYNASLRGSGAIAQGSGATAVGERGVNVGGNVTGNITTGDTHNTTNIVYGVSPAGGTAAALPPELAPLRQQMVQSFNLSELQTLAFDLGIVYDDLPHDTRSEFAESLITYCHRNGRLPALLTLCRNLRSHVSWPRIE